MDAVTLVSARTRAADYLDRARNADGSWGYLAGQAGAGEPTLLAVAAGRPAPLDWIATAELDYAWLLLPAALVGVSGAESLVAAGVERLLGTIGVIVTEQDAVANDFSIPAWPWVEGTVPWVEPTAYAVISLKRAGQGAHARVVDGERMLRDRQCSDGGWNYGNSDAMGTPLEHEVAPTAWATLALPPGPDVDRALVLLDGSRRLRSTLTLALSVLAYSSHGRDLTDLPDLLVQRQLPDGSFSGRADWTSLALMALRAVEEGRHAFVLRP